jgi:hypothetical protein
MSVALSDTPLQGKRKGPQKGPFLVSLPPKEMVTVEKLSYFFFAGDFFAAGFFAAAFFAAIVTSWLFSLSAASDRSLKNTVFSIFANPPAAFPDSCFGNPYYCLRALGGAHYCFCYQTETGSSRENSIWEKIF